MLVYANADRSDRTCKILDILRKKSICAIIAQGGAIRNEQVRTIVLDAGFPLIGDHTHVNGLYNLAMTMGAVSAITAFGLSIPSDIAVAGCGDSIPVDEMVVPAPPVAFSYHEEAKRRFPVSGRLSASKPYSARNACIDFGTGMPSFA